LMVLFAVLEVLRQKATGESRSELYAHAWKFISKAEARDKVGKIFQYGCRACTGFLSHLPSDSPLQVWKPLFPEIQTTLTWARRTNRWGKEMPHIEALGEAIFKKEPFEALSRICLLLYLFQDHIYWLLKVGILKFPNYTAIQWHRRNLKFVLPSYVINFCLCWTNIQKIKQKQRNKDSKYSGSEQAEKKAELDIYDNKRMMVRYTLTFFQIVHGSAVKILDDSYIGLFGMVSSYIDASKQW